MKRTVTKIRRLFLPRGVCNIGLGTSGIKPDAIERWQSPEGFKTLRDKPSKSGGLYARRDMEDGYKTRRY